jgi:hypothetical protein
MNCFALRSILVCGLMACAVWRSALVHGAGALDKYLTSDVIGVASLDFAKLDMPAFLDEVGALGVLPPEELGRQRQVAVAAQGMYAELPKLGAKRAYVLLRQSDLQHGGSTFVVEVADGADAGKVAALLKGWLEVARAQQAFGAESRFLPQFVDDVDGVVLAASTDEQMTLLTGARPTPREDAAAALAALQASDLGVVLFGDADTRRVLREMFPTLPAPFTEIDGKLLADGVAWVGATVKLPPQPQISVAIEATTDETAKAVHAAIEKGLTLLKGMAMAAAMQGENEAGVALAALGLVAPKADGRRMSVTIGDDEVEVQAIRKILSPALSNAREAARRSQRMNNFRQIAISMFNYEANYKAFPPSASYDEAGKPLLSWRVHVLPYLEQQALYEQFHLDEPWDSAHNRALIAQMPKVYADPSRPELAAAGKTTYLVPTGEGLVFGGKEGTKLAEIRDGTSNTILLAEVLPEHAVEWTKPSDWEVDLVEPLAWLVPQGAEAKTNFITAFSDGSCRTMMGSIDRIALKGLLTASGQEVVTYP